MCPEILPFSWHWHTPYCSNEAPDCSPCKSPLNLWVLLLSCIPYQCWLSEGTNEADFPEWLRRQWFWLILHLTICPPSQPLTHLLWTHPPIHPHVHPPTYRSPACSSTYLSAHPPIHHSSPQPHRLSTHTFIHIYQLTHPSMHSQLFQQFTVSCALSHK